VVGCSELRNVAFKVDKSKGTKTNVKTVQEDHSSTSFNEEIEFTFLDKSIKKTIFFSKSNDGYKGKIETDISKPDGMNQKLLDITRLKILGWEHKIKLLDGLEIVYKDYLFRKVGKLYFSAKQSFWQGNPEKENQDKLLALTLQTLNRLYNESIKATTPVSKHS
jgi:hypothetical protein